MNAAAFPQPRSSGSGAKSRAGDQAGARLIFQRCDGKPAGETVILSRARRRLSAIVKQHADRSRPHIVCVYRKDEPWAPTDFSVRMRKTWRHTRIGPNDTVAIIYAPRGGGGAAGGNRGGKMAGIGLLVATIALAAVGQFWAIGAINGAIGLAATSAVGGTIWAATSAALLMGAGYLLSKATQPKANKDDNNRPLYGVSGGGNLARLGDRIPVIYGRCWTSPDLSQPDYTIYEGDNQTLFKRMTVGLGKYAIKTIRVGAAVMWTAAGGVQAPFTGAQVDIIAPGASSTLVPGQVASAPSVAGLEVPRATGTPAYAGPFAFPADSPPQSRIQLDWTIPQGVFGIPTSGKYEGKQFPTNWGVLFEYAPCDEDGEVTGPWETLYTESGNTLMAKPRRVTTIVDIPAGAGRYAYRAQNTAPGDLPGVNITNMVAWEALRSHIPETIIREDVTEIAIKVSSGPGLGVTAFANVEVEVQRVLPVWDGSSWAEAETRKAVWAAVDILRNSAYGVGMVDGQIDLARFRHYATTLTQYDTYDGVIRGPVSVYEAMSTVLGVMRATPLRLGNVWSLVRDEQQLVRKHVISRRQILRDSTGQQFNLDLSDGSANVIVEWSHQGDPKRQRDERINFGAVTNSPRRIRAEGVSSAEHAMHIATWAASTAYRRRERRTVRMEWAGRLIKPNDKCLIEAWYFDGVETVGVFGRSGNNLELDQPIVLEPSSYGVLRARDGREFGPILLTQVDETTVAMDTADLAAAQAQTGLTIAQVMSTATQAGTSLVIGDLTTVSDSWLVRSIRFSGENDVEIEAIYDAPGVWSDLGETIIGPPPPPSSGLVNEAAIDIAFLSARAVQTGTQMYMVWSAGRPRVPVNYVVRVSYDDWETYEEAYHGPQNGGDYPVRDTPEPIKVRAFAYAADGQRSGLRETQFVAPRAVISGQTALVRVDYDDLKQGIRYRTQLLPDIDPIFGSALEGMVDAFEGRRLAETGIRKTEQVKQDLTQQIVSVTTEIRAQLDSGFADAFQQIGVLQTQTTSLAQSYTGLSAQLQSGFASYNQQIAALVTQDQAFAGSLTTFNARLGSAETGLSQEVALRANQYGALSQSITNLTATFNNNAASTSQSLQALASADQAIAQQVNQVNARLGNLLAEGLIQFAAVAAPAGVFARFAVILRAQAGGQPFETGLYLELIQQGSTFYGQFFVDTNRFVVGNPLTRSIPFSVIDGTTYIDNAAIRSGTITRHASASSGGRNVTTTLPVQVGGRVTIIGVYRGGQFAVNGSGSNIRIRRNGSDIEVAPVSYVNYPINAGGSQSSYNNTVVMASYDVGYNGEEAIEVILDQATYVGGPFDLVGVSVSAVCNNK